MPRPVLLATAWEDISRIADYHLRAVGPCSAEDITDKILDTIDLLVEMPYLGPLHQDPILCAAGFRKLLCGSYVCIYRIIGDIPTVYDIFHGSQNYTDWMHPQGKRP